MNKSLIIILFLFIILIIISSLNIYFKIKGGSSLSIQTYATPDYNNLKDYTCINKNFTKEETEYLKKNKNLDFGKIINKKFVKVRLNIIKKIKQLCSNKDINYVINFIFNAIYKPIEKVTKLSINISNNIGQNLLKLTNIHIKKFMKNLINNTKTNIFSAIKLSLLLSNERILSGLIQMKYWFVEIYDIDIKILKYYVKEWLNKSIKLFYSGMLDIIIIIFFILLGFLLFISLFLISSINNLLIRIENLLQTRLPVAAPAGLGPYYGWKEILEDRIIQTELVRIYGLISLFGLFIIIMDVLNYALKMYNNRLIILKKMYNFDYINRFEDNYEYIHRKIINEETNKNEFLKELIKNIKKELKDDHKFISNKDEIGNKYFEEKLEEYNKILKKIEKDDVEENNSEFDIEKYFEKYFGK